MDSRYGFTWFFAREHLILSNLHSAKRFNEHLFPTSEMQIERFDMESTFHSPAGIRVMLTREQKDFHESKRENNCLIDQRFPTIKITI